MAAVARPSRHLLLWAAGLAATGATACLAADAEKLAVKRIFPAGGAAGTSVVVKAEGSFPRWPVRVWTDRSGTTWKPLDDKGSFEVAIDAGESVGVHRLRMHDDREAGPLLRFVVGRGAETVEAEPNDRPPQAETVASLPVTINGVLEKPGDVDGFGVPLEAGQTLVASLDAHRGPGSPIDAVLEVVDDRGGYVARNLDAHGLDPRIVFTAARAGRFTVRIYAFPAEPNSTIGLSGGVDHTYRLSLTTGGFLAGTLPAAVPRTGTATVAPLGWNLPAGLTAIPAAAAAPQTSVWVAFEGVAGVAELPVVATDRLPIVGPEATTVAVEPPLVASGRFAAPKQELVQRITARKSQPLLVSVEGLAAGSEAEVLLDVRAADGRSVLAKTDRDPPAAWTPPDDAEYAFVLRDRRGGSGPAHFFRLVVVPSEPAVRATCDLDAVTGAVGGTIDLPIAVERLRGWSEAVEFALVDPPAGITAEAVTSAATGDSAKKVTLVIKAGAPASGPLSIVARRVPVAGAAPQGAAPQGAATEAVTNVSCGKQKLPVLWLTVPPPAPPAAADAPAKPAS